MVFANEGFSPESTFVERKNRTKTICGLPATQIFTSLQTKTGNDSNLHLSDCTSCNAAKYIFYEESVPVFQFLTHPQYVLNGEERPHGFNL